MDTKLLEEIKPFFSSEVIGSPLSKLSLEDQAMAIAFIRFLSKTNDLREAELKETLLISLKHQGTITDPEKGHKQLSLGEVTLVAQKTKAKLPNEDSLKAMLKEKGIDLLQVFDEIKVLELNPSKLNHLIDLGKLDAAEIEKLQGESITLLAKPSKNLQERFEVMRQGKVEFGSETIKDSPQAPVTTTWPMTHSLIQDSPKPKKRPAYKRPNSAYKRPKR